MKTFKSYILLFMSFMLIVPFACKKDTPPEPIVAQTGNMRIEFEHVWGMMALPFNLNSPLVHPMTGDTMNFSTFKYYVSNIRLKKADGTWWNEPESYHIVDASTNAGRFVNIDQVPAGEYTDLEVTFGVDSARNVSGAQTGALAVSNNMFWSWNTGYIMLKAEGTSPQANGGNFIFHLGGFRQANNIVTTRNYSLGTTRLRIRPDATPKVHMKANPARLRHTLGSLSSNAVVHSPGANAQTMANDFWNSVNFDHLHN